MEAYRFLCIFVLLQAPPTSLGFDATCLNKGECLDGIFVGDTPGSSASDCLDQCVDSDPCTHFTFHPEESLCFLTHGCPSLSTEACPQCLSGSRGQCLGCYEQGYCLGTFVGGSLASSAEDCQAACQQQADCQWFNFHTTDNACSFVSDCAFLDETCGDTCWHGSKFCNATEDGSDEYSGLVMAIGGIGANYDAEIVDLSEEKNVTLPKPGNLSLSLFGMVANVVDDQVLVCSGYQISNCYVYDFELNRWNETTSLDTQRYGAVSFVLDGSRWYILGGEDLSTGVARYLDTSVVYTHAHQGGTFEAGGKLPYTGAFGCVAAVNATHVFFAGGWDGRKYRRDAFLLEAAEWRWTRLPDMGVERANQACGRAGAGSIVVLGGSPLPAQATSEVLSLRTLEWTEGPALPTGTGKLWGVSQVYQDERTFFVLGGKSGTDHLLNSVYEVDAETFELRLREERLAAERQDHAVVPVPKSVIRKLRSYS